ncbi:hypothetical protein BO86DRAFT_34958 [Aspergillus japonicus CBS 114.51]|uniref:Uncharacterized protein n=1 Tax=Aspergillus japonicus CBS 114.51 TaxID=1448312 RepID=A0A8T8X6X4_ASPJA|nr:hypothetical protein BO86DRAFT_34958 [Aspergillus japonicus CBS 114.51]RAH83801.1 hypothetical protein BO86DRAFT_34958 [Aspergillus japonicus CBS 114.51]
MINLSPPGDRPRQAVSSRRIWVRDFLSSQVVCRRRRRCRCCCRLRLAGAALSPEVSRARKEPWIATRTTQTFPSDGLACRITRAHLLLIFPPRRITACRFSKPSYLSRPCTRVFVQLAMRQICHPDRSSPSFCPPPWISSERVRHTRGGLTF